MYVLERDVIRAYFNANAFSEIVMKRPLGPEEIGGMFISMKRDYPVVGKNLGVAFLRLGLDAIKWFLPSGSVAMAKAKLFALPVPYRRQICIGCDWGIAVRASESGVDLQDLREARECPRIYVSNEIGKEVLEVAQENGYDLERERERARLEILTAMGQDIG
ncbi:hypothetical protein GWK48_08145 [Metallosphaera tengchongensis]|uniref:Uncharacterized protein n=1 Tax=Metallosphaera tengchongensis TaxID=1532350 RepID=A0A6N0NY93_9CREN|nr:hypothetical protein [Metallosphaera tengchongensis]QKR00348.1 hypothetical protein GWK48_08145 [Metallosphaera tengchongensis]